MNYEEEDWNDDGRDFGGLTYDDFVKECEKMNPGSTGYSSDFD